MVQLQAGLQYSTKPISLGKKSASSKTSTQTSSKTTTPTSSKTETFYYSGCGKKYSQTKTSTSEKDSWTVRIQPSAGIGYVPSGKPDMSTDYFATSPGYTYNAGNISTEFIGGMGFEFARNKKKFMTLSVNYFKGLGSNETSFATYPGGKEEITMLRSEVSGWNASLGVPITFTKNQLQKNRLRKPKRAPASAVAITRAGADFKQDFIYHTFNNYTGHTVPVYYLRGTLIKMNKLIPFIYSNNLR